MKHVLKAMTMASRMLAVGGTTRCVSLRGSHGDIKQATFVLGLGRRAGTDVGRRAAEDPSREQALEAAKACARRSGANVYTVSTLPRPAGTSRFWFSGLSL